MSGILVRLDHTTYRRLLREASRERMGVTDMLAHIVTEALAIRENSRTLAVAIIDETP